MKGLEKIPSVDDLRAAYDRMTVAPTAPEVVLWAQWARFDPRLAEQLVLLFAHNWKSWNACTLHEELQNVPWPAAFGVLAEQALAVRLIPSKDRAIFRKWCDLVLTGVLPASGEQFFIGLRKVGGKQMRLDAEFPLQAYRKWGYLGRDLLLNKASGQAAILNRTLVPATVRKHGLGRLMEERKRLTVEDYRKALDYRVSRRQAELDLTREKRLTPVGQTRGRFYRVK
jgi:hypothetical protein